MHAVITRIPYKWRAAVVSFRRSVEIGDTETLLPVSRDDAWDSTLRSERHTFRIALQEGKQ